MWQSPRAGLHGSTLAAAALNGTPDHLVYPSTLLRAAAASAGQCAHASAHVSCRASAGDTSPAELLLWCPVPRHPPCCAQPLLAAKPRSTGRVWACRKPSAGHPARVQRNCTAVAKPQGSQGSQLHLRGRYIGLQSARSKALLYCWLPHVEQGAACSMRPKKTNPTQPS